MTLQQFLAYCDDMVRPTEPMFRSVPADKLDWKPTENSFTIAQQMVHMAGALEVYANGIVTGNWGFDSMRERFVQNRHTPSMNVEEAVALLNTNYQIFKSQLSTLSEEEFNSGEIDAPQFGAKTPRWRVAMLAVEHHINHKAELFMCLKILGVKMNTGTLYRG